MTNKERAEMAKMILAKIKVDADIENAPEELPKPKKSYSQKVKEVNDYIKNELTPTEIDLFVSSANQREKARVVDAIIKNFQTENRQKRAVDKSAERVRNDPQKTIYTNNTTYADKSKYYDNLINYYKKEKKAEVAKKAVDNKTETIRNRPGTITPIKTGDIFTNIAAKEEIFTGRKDFIFYNKEVKKYTSKSDPRRYVETDVRTSAYNGNVSVGKFFSFRYWAKTESMKVFDRSPLIYVLEDQGSHFRGINFHYIPNKNLRFEMIEQLIRGETPIFPENSYHTYSKEENCLLSPLYHIQPNEMKICVILNLERWYYR